MTTMATFLNGTTNTSPRDLDDEEINYRPFLNRDRHVRIFDEDLRTCETLSMLFRLEGFMTSFFAERSAFLDKADTRSDVLVANFTQWDDNARDMLNEVKQKNRETVVVGLLDNDSVELAVDLMRAGACDVLSKPIDMERLVISVREELRRDVQMGVSAGGQRTIVVQGFKTLTQRERDVLQLIVAGNSNKIAAKTLGISPRTIEVHRSRLMRKLGAHNTADLMRIVLTA